MSLLKSIVAQLKFLAVNHLILLSAQPYTGLRAGQGVTTALWSKACRTPMGGRGLTVASRVFPLNASLQLDMPNRSTLPRPEFIYTILPAARSTAGPKQPQAVRQPSCPIPLQNVYMLNPLSCSVPVNYRIIWVMSYAWVREGG